MTIIAIVLKFVIKLALKKALLAMIGYTCHYIEGKCQNPVLKEVFHVLSSKRPASLAKKFFPDDWIRAVVAKLLGCLD